MTKFKSIILLWAVACLTACTQTPPEVKALRAEVEANLTQNILPFWERYTIDPAGGFYGQVGIDGTAVPEADKGAILNARILWTFSKAAQLYPVAGYRQWADRAAEYLTTHFIDPEYGGVYWTVASDGTMKDATKQSYATAFAIYGLAEHYRATGSERSLQAAKDLYHTLEAKAHDVAKQGYIESFARDYTRADIKGVDGMAGATKSMNTHIHIIEAYTTLYQVWPDAGLRANIIELLDILSSKLYDAERGHLILYCDDDWHSLEEVDSFGHDIETSWLLCEAANALGDPQIIQKTNAQAVKMTEVALSEGLNAEGVMLYERNANGYRTNLSWWPQCETIIGSINAWQITGEQRFFDAALKNWNYVKTHFVDHQHGGWYKGLNAQGQPTREAKVSLWNCPYHNSRMVYELLHRLK
ncbi:MAG: AGE family epimerase/isomerase [Bacteroidaceae bacterium]|nr:AGE family epimerase/isomerase [Bacteroidaceae bacterium]